MKKQIALFIIGLFIFLGIYVYVMNNKLYTNKAIVIDSSYINTLVEIRENNIKLGEANIKSGIFKEDDEIIVKYYKKWNKINIVKILDDNPDSLISNINNDFTVRRYREMIHINYEDIGLMLNLDNIYAIPIILNNQEYELINEDAFWAGIVNFNKEALFSSVPTNRKIVAELDNNYEIVSFKNNDKDVDYKLVDNKINFNSLGDNIYILVIKYDNENTIKYIFK